MPGGTFLVHTPAPGTLTVGLTTPTPRPAGGGTLLMLDFQVPPTAPPGPTSLDLQAVHLNEGSLVLTPGPRPGPDPTDGAVTIQPAAPAPVRARRARGAAGAARRAAGDLGFAPFFFPSGEGGSAQALPGPGSARRMLDDLAAAHGFAGPEYDLLARLRAAPRPAWLRRFLLDLAAPPEALDPNRDLRIELPPAPALAVGAGARR